MLQINHLSEEGFVEALIREVFGTPCFDTGRLSACGAPAGDQQDGSFERQSEKSHLATFNGAYGNPSSLSRQPKQDNRSGLAERSGILVIMATSNALPTRIRLDGKEHCTYKLIEGRKPAY